MALRGRREPTSADGLGGPSYKTSNFNGLRYKLPELTGRLGQQLYCRPLAEVRQYNCQTNLESGGHQLVAP
jgi:hypothetical protein